MTPPAARPVPAAKDQPTTMPAAIAVASGKGGVGKTWFSVTLAHALAETAPTLLFDGDLGLANIDVQLGLAPDHDLSAAVEGKRDLSQVITKHGPTGIHIIAGRSGSTSLATVNTRRVAAIVRRLGELSGDYAHTILDLGAGVDSNVRTLAVKAGMIIVVLTEEPTSLTDAYAFIKLTAVRAPQCDLRVVVNQARGHSQGERTYQTLTRACQDFLQISPPLLGIVRQDPHVPGAIRAQSPLLTRSPHCDAAEDIRAIAAQITATRAGAQ